MFLRIVVLGVFEAVMLKIGRVPVCIKQEGGL